MFKKSLIAITVLLGFIGAGGVAKMILSHKLEG